MALLSATAEGKWLYGKCTNEKLLNVSRLYKLRGQISSLQT
jgi:hypothetical protein